MAVFFRIFIGLVLLISGFDKVINPWQNFLYVIQAYNMFPSILEKLAALSVPWFELIIGIFMVLGLWLNWALRGTLLLFAAFIVIVGQALLRHLPIDQCGCFGEAIHISPQQIIAFDSIMLLMTIWLIKHLPQTKHFSLDQQWK